MPLRGDPEGDHVARRGAGARDDGPRAQDEHRVARTVLEDDRLAGGVAPHLHVPVMDRPDPLASNGLPFEFDSFALDGRVTSGESLQGTLGPVPFRIDRAGAGPRAGVSPLGLDVMGYPAGP